MHTESYTSTNDATRPTLVFINNLLAALLLLCSTQVVAVPVTYEFTGVITHFGSNGNTNTRAIANIESGYNAGDQVFYQITIDRDLPAYRLLDDGTIQPFTGFEVPSARVERFFADLVTGDIVPYGGGHGYFSGLYTSFTAETVFAKLPTATEQTRFDISTGLTISSTVDNLNYIDDLVIGDPFRLINSWTSPTNGNLHYMFGDLTVTRIGDITEIPLPPALILFMFGLSLLKTFSATRNRMGQ